jgi:predicted  nucleic acid-binding Zn-ribbon protein
VTTGVPASSEPPAPLDVLLDVQDLDTAISQLQHRRATLPERAELAELDAALGRLERRAAEAGAERDELAQRQSGLEQQIAALTSRRESLEARLYSARGTAARDLQAMDDEIRHLRQRRGELEDAELEVMVAAEPLDAELAELEAERERLSSAARGLRTAIATSEGAIDAELSERAVAREAAVSTLPPDLLERYEGLRTRLGGTGAARLVGSRCSGCHLELPSMEVDRIRRLPGGTVVTCEQCGRILVPSPGARAPDPPS